MKYVGAIVLDLLAVVVAVVLLMAVINAITDPNYQAGQTARWDAYQQTERERERTRQVQAQEWNETARTYGTWAGGALIVAVVTAGGAWAVVEWQRQRTARHVATETQTTQRHLITAKRDVALAWLEQYGTPRAFVGVYQGKRGVFLPESGKFITEAACAEDLGTAIVPHRAQAPAVWQPPSAPARQFRIVGEVEPYDGGEW